MTSALLLDDGSAITVGGLTLTERGAVLAHRAGFGPIHVWSAAPAEAPDAARSRPRGVPIVQLPPGVPPLEGMADVKDVVVIAPNVLYDA